LSSNVLISGNLQNLKHDVANVELVRRWAEHTSQTRTSTTANEWYNDVESVAGRYISPYRLSKYPLAKPQRMEEPASPVSYGICAREAPCERNLRSEGMFVGEESDQGRQTFMRRSSSMNLP
jgi:hypothetical protein